MKIVITGLTAKNEKVCWIYAGKNLAGLQVVVQEERTDDSPERGWLSLFLSSGQKHHFYVELADGSMDLDSTADVHLHASYWSMESNSSSLQRNNSEGDFNQWGSHFISK